MSYFKYVLTRGGGDLFLPDNLTWIQRLIYRLKGYSIISYEKWESKYEQEN